MTDILIFKDLVSISQSIPRSSPLSKKLF